MNLLNDTSRKMTNPLIEKFYELHPEKKEKPKVIKAENAKVEYELDPNFLGQLAKLNPPTPITSNLTSPSVATSNAGITKASNTYTTHDIHDNDKSFLRIADKIKNGNAQVSSMSMEINDVLGCYDGVKKITFEVYL